MKCVNCGVWPSYRDNPAGHSPSIRRSRNGIMLTSLCRQPGVPEHLDKSLETAENCRIRSKSQDPDKLTSISVLS